MGLSQTEIAVLLKMRAEGQQAIDLFSGTLGKAGASGETAAAGVDKASSSMERSGVAATAAGVAIGEFATKIGEKLVDLGKDTVLTAARTQGLGAVAEFLGQRAGKTRDEVNSLVDSIKRQGVTTQEASNLVIQLSRANLGLENATKLAAVAQNGAFIAGESTAEALGQIITGIVTLQPELIRSAGITVSLEQAEREYAKAMHVSTEALTSQQKQQLLLNAVLKEGQAINGVYGLSMQYVGKQLTSLPRYIEEAKNAVGQELLPVLGLAVTGFTDLLKIITAHPAVFVDLGIAVTAIVAPLLAAKAAAVLGIPSFAALSATIAETGAVLFSVATNLGAVGGLRAGLNAIAQTAGITVAGLGALGTAAAVAAAAFAGWEFGRWIAGITGADKAIANLAARVMGYGNVAKEEAAAGQDAINLAFERTGVHAKSAAEALELNTTWLKRHNAEAGNDQIALARLAAEAQRFGVDMDGVTVHVGAATDGLHKFWDEVNRRQLQVPKITLPQLASEKGQILDPAKDAAEFLDAAMNGTANAQRLIAQRAQEVSHALQLIGSEVGHVKQALADHNLTAKDLVETYHISTEAANALVEQFKKEAEAAKKAAEEHKKWAAVVEEMESLGTDFHKTLEELAPATLRDARAALEAGANHEALAAYYGLTKTQLAALIKEEDEYEKTLKKIQKIETEIATGGYRSILDIDPAGRARANAELARMDYLADAYKSNLDHSRSLYDQYNALIEKGSEETASYQIEQVRRWQDAQEGMINYSVDNWRDGYDMIGRIAEEKIRQIQLANNPFFQAFKTGFQGIATAITQNFGAMLTGAKSAGEAFTDIFQGVKQSLIGIFAEIADYFIKQMLARMLLAAAGASNGWASMIAMSMNAGVGAGGAGGGGVNYGGLAQSVATRYLQHGATTGGAWAADGTFVGSSSVGGVGAGGGSGAALGAAAGYGGIAVGSWMLGSWLGSYTENKYLGAAYGAGAGAATGAAVGSVVPGIGTGVGAGVGAIAGAIAGWRAAGHLYEDVKNKREELEQHFGGVEDLIKSVGDAYQYIGKSGSEAEAALHQLWDARNINEYNDALKNIGPVLEQYQREILGVQTAQKYGFGLGDLHGDAFANAFHEQFTALEEDRKHMAEAGIDMSKILEHMAPAYNDLINAALKSGEEIPPGLQPIIAQLERMGLLTDQNKRLLQGLAEGPDFAQLEGIASHYGITLSQLGSKFQQAHVGAEASQIMKDFKALVDAGADADGVLAGMKDEIQNVVKESLQFGTTIPTAMRPLIEQLARTGQLLDENGNQMNDVSRLHFADGPEESTKKLTDSLDRLADMLAKRLPQAAHDGAGSIQRAFDDVDITIPVNYRTGTPPPPGLPTPPNPDENQPSGAAQGIYANRPTLAIFGEGGQPEIGGPQSFFREILASLGLGGSSSNQPAADQGKDPGGAAGGGDTYVFQMSVIDATDLQQQIETKVLPIIVNAVRNNRRQVRSDLVQALGVA